MKIRLNKYISSSGYCSRRKADKLIFDGFVVVDSNICDNPATMIDPSLNTVIVNGMRIKPEQNMVYIMLNKPVGYMSSVSDPNYDKFVTDLIKGHDERLYPVGRLDIDSHGLLLITNDGNLTYKLTHPKNNIPKKYKLKLDKRLNSKDINKLKDGVLIDQKYKCNGYVEKRIDGLFITIYEGRNRQIRKMFSALGYTVTDLQRVSIGDLVLSDLKIGHWRYLTNDEISYLEEL